MKTVNVIHIQKGCVAEIFSYSDTEAGNRRAEEQFRLMFKEFAPRSEQKNLESYLEDGACYLDSGMDLIIEISSNEVDFI